MENYEDRIRRAAELLASEFGPDWRSIAGMLGTEGLRKRVGKELTSFMAFPDRGDGGDSKRGEPGVGGYGGKGGYGFDANGYGIYAPNGENGSDGKEL